MIISVINHSGLSAEEVQSAIRAVTAKSRKILSPTGAWEPRSAWKAG